MKYFLIFIPMFGCAVGSVVDPKELETEPMAPQKPAVSVSDTTVTKDCSIHNTVWGGNCRLDKHLCVDGSFYLSSICYGNYNPYSDLPRPPF